MSVRSHMNGWPHNEKGRRITRRERGLPKLRGFTRGVQGNKAGPRDIPPHYCRAIGGSILTVHRRIIIDYFRQAKRIEAGRYCWNPVLKETSDAIG